MKIARKRETQPITAVWRNGGCSASYDILVVGSSAVLRLNFCAKNPPLRQAAKRWMQLHLTTKFNRTCQQLLNFSYRISE